MVRVLDCGSSGPGLCCVRGAKHFTVSLPRCINGYRRNAGGSPSMD